MRYRVGLALRFLGIHPFRLTSLCSGAFERSYEQRRQQGYEQGKHTPPRMNAAAEDITTLIELEA